MAEVQHKYVTWSEGSEATIEILPPPGGSKRHRIISVSIACNSDTDQALLHRGDVKPLSGSPDVIEFVDSVRQTNDSPLVAPAFTKGNQPVSLTVTPAAASTSTGKLHIVFINEEV